MNHRKYSCKGSTDQLFCRSELPSRRSERSSPSSLHLSSPMRSGFSRRTNVKHVHRACLRTAYISCLHLSNTCSGYQIGQSECTNEKLHLACGSLLQSLESPDSNERKEAEKNVSSQFRLWLCICLGNLCKDNALVQSELFKAGIHFRLLSHLNDDEPDVRAASCYALACLLGSAARPDSIKSDVASIPPMQSQQSQPHVSPLQPLAGGTTLLMANLSNNQGI